MVEGMVYECKEDNFQTISTIRQFEIEVDYAGWCLVFVEDLPRSRTTWGSLNLSLASSLCPR
jgi:hypothetical protein